MKKVIVIILALTMFVFGLSFSTVSASDGVDGLPDVLAPIAIEQG